MAIVQLIDPNDIHTAAATWSGFIYQGKVALYHVLKLLNEDIANVKYSLQLDSLEDFAIVEEVDGLIQPITLHQVKAMKSKLYSSYKEAFDKLEKRIDDYPCEGAYFHLTTENEKSKEEIKEKHPKIDIYNNYEGNCFCPLEEIDEKCDSEISKYLKENKLSHFDTTELREISRLNLESKISGRIIEVHSQNHNADVNIRKGAYYSIIPLEDFVNILKSNPQELLDNEDYYLFIIQELLNQYYTEFCLEITEDLENEEKELTEGNKEKLSNYLAQINGLDKSSLLKFIQSILPNRSVKLGTIKEFKDFNVQQDEFKYSFLQILLELIESTGIIGKNLSWKDDDDLRYTATAIHAGQRSKHQICKNIFKNINDLDIEVPYESNMLITASIDVTSIKDQLNKQYKVEEELGDKKNNIVKWFDIGLISLDNAKDKIG
ncbi:ABC-three component system protein [Zunongwangia profunda]|uniref:ABC-three component system protein n=1 Tax=Zunongwangia profunda TaxID=398743 RepID=UPI001D18E134|nr:ABC-three component system protein [Zunongwangia profunda]MCC4230407.1 hypothetical protein [Zunongwangia profunda]|tara:strand:- start:7131 stop:8432 length:1302 start_codon:yes stop_codon:yes gene_type:complete